MWEELPKKSWLKFREILFNCKSCHIYDNRHHNAFIMLVVPARRSAAAARRGGSPSTRSHTQLWSLCSMMILTMFPWQCYDEENFRTMMIFWWWWWQRWWEYFCPPRPTDNVRKPRANWSPPQRTDLKTKPQAKRHKPSLLFTSLAIFTSLTFITRQLFLTR